MKVVTILSGGMDSATLAYSQATEADAEQLFVSFDYGQRHAKELRSAAEIANQLKSRHVIISLHGLGKHLVSALTQEAIKVPEGHYEKESMSLTVVPNRNAIMLSVAWGIACSYGAVRLSYGAHAGDHAIYPDCRPEFVQALCNAFRIGSEGIGDPKLKIVTPFIDKSKGDIVKMGLSLKVPYELTWTCYKGEVISCGRCGCCVERLQAFDENNAVDPLEYADREYWKSAVNNYMALKTHT